MYKVKFPFDYKPRAEAPKISRIEYWYDRSLRLWTILVQDEEGNQIGDAHYDVRISDARVTLEQLRKENPRAGIKKFPAV